MTANTTVLHALAGLHPVTPLTHGGLTLLPLTTHRSTKARYVLLDEAIRRERLVVTEVNDQGSVPFLRAFNKGPWPVLGFDGEELVGAKQNRIINTTVLLGVGERVVPVSCVEAGRWSRRGGSFAASEWASHPEMRRQKEVQVRLSLLQSRRSDEQVLTQAERAMRYRSDQGKVWDEVARGSEQLGVSSDTSAMADAYGARSFDLAKVLQAFGGSSGEGQATVPVEGMVAAAVFLGGRFLCLDALWPATRFAELYPKLLRGYALESLYLEGEVKSSPEDPEADLLRLLHELTGARLDEQDGVDLGRDVRVEARSVLGAGLSFQDELLQLSVFPRR